MKKSEKKLDSPTDESIKTYYGEASMDALLYWTNTTTQVAGPSATINNLLDMLATCILELVPEDKAEQVEEVVLSSLKTAFKQLTVSGAKVSAKSSDKDNMN